MALFEVKLDLLLKILTFDQKKKKNIMRLSYALFDSTTKEL